MKAILGFCKALWGDEEGATAVEYGVLVALIIAACVVIIGTLGGKVNNAFNDVVAQLTP
ncbi:MAG: Flp family type IVb pilin [Desulfobulbaceae bacterium]|nr:Flp family type IVb pilin [Desulfobulbaceae bacterium]